MGKLIVKDDVPDALKAEVVVEEIYEAARGNYNLRDATRLIDTGENIHISMPIIDGRVSGEIDVGELEEAAMTSQSYIDIDATLHKNVVHVALSTESQLSAQKDIMGWNIEDSGRDIARMENTEIADAMGDLTSTAAANWTDNSNDPFEDIMSAVETIQNEHFNPKQIWMEPSVYAALVANSNIVDRLERGVTADGMLPSIANLKIGVDPMLDDETAVVLDQAAPTFVLADGPGVINEYENPTAFFDGYVVADFLHIEEVISDAALQLTGCLS